MGWNTKLWHQMLAVIKLSWKRWSHLDIVSRLVVANHQSFPFSWAIPIDSASNPLSFGCNDLKNQQTRFLMIDVESRKLISCLKWIVITTKKNPPELNRSNRNLFLFENYRVYYRTRTFTFNVLAAYRVIHLSCRILLSFYSLMPRDMDLKLIKS